MATSKTVKDNIPALAELASLIGDPAVRHRGTIGGSIANNDPNADYPAACLGLGATIITNKRRIPADEFFKGLFETCWRTARGQGGSVKLHRVVDAVSALSATLPGVARLGKRRQALIAQRGSRPRVGLTHHTPITYCVVLCAACRET